jgi:tetratricopeptide (TPR) repeat protein
MPLPVTSQYAPPKSWEEFESLCADLYARVWKTNLQKGGRQGQPQGGVDVYGDPDGKGYFGIQCKNKGRWPPTDLATVDIDEEVKKAKTWRPRLKKYFVATTAGNDGKAQAHVRKLSAVHKKRLFSVEVLSWDEIARELSGHQDLLRKYGYLPDLSGLLPELDAVPAKTAKLVAEQLRADGPVARDGEQSQGVIDAMERDLAGQYERAMKRSFFSETMKVDEYASVADVASQPEYARVSSALRRRIFLRAARSAAVRGTLDKADQFLQAAQALQGPDSDALARARILERRGDIDGALVLIRDENDADSLSTVLNIIARARGQAEGLKWLSAKGLTVRDLTINGIQTLASELLRQQDYEGARKLLGELTPAQLDDGPYFRVAKALANIASVLPEPDRGIAVQGLLSDAMKGTRSILDAAATSALLDVAITELTAFLPVAAALDLSDSKRLGETYLRWAELLHPHRKDAALARLREEIKDPKSARSRLSLAFAFDPDFDPQPFEQYLKSREEVGGLDDDELHAALTIRINSNDAASVAAFIARHRPRFDDKYDPPIFTVEIQALALAGDTASARLLLEENKDKVTPQGFTAFEALIAKAEGNDPVTEDLKVYEASKTVDALRNLVISLARKKDHRATAKYSEELYAQTKDPHDIARTAQAFAFLGDGSEFIRVIEAHPFLQGREPELLRHYGWELFRKGRLSDARDVTDRLARLSEDQRDLQLEIAIAIESGEWESLAKPLTAYLDDVSRHSGIDLMRAAHVAQQSGQGPMMDLLKVAIAKAGDNPHVWLGGYTLIIEEGLEEEIPESHDWLNRALVLSDNKGPVQQFALKDLVPQQVEWNKRTRDISERITRAEVPLVIAAPGLRTTIVDILLRNLVRNKGLEDARRKYAIPLFSGHRPPWKVGPAVNSLGLDISALLVLGWLRLLPKVLGAFGTVALPATILSELFEGKRRVQHIQKSRIKRARELEQAILRQKIKIARPPEKANDPLSMEVGASLAGLIRAAAESGGTVLRPAPIHRPGLEQIPADVSSELPHLSDMHALLKVLSDKGVINQKQEETAKKYFELQDKGLPGCAHPDPDKPLFIHELALVYLQYTELLDAVLKAFKDVRIDGSSEDEALAIIDNHQHVEDVLRVIDDVRATIKDANAKRKLVFGPRRADGKESGEDLTSSTLHLLSDLTTVDALVCDDRALNKENFAADAKGKRIPRVTTLDLLEELRERGAVTESEWLDARDELRKGGATIMPVQDNEIVRAAKRSGGVMSAEMRAIQESIDLARVAEVPSFPREVQWFAKTSMAAKAAVIQIWKTEPDFAVAGRHSNWAMGVLPRPEDWASRWQDGPPSGWVEAVNRVTMSSLAMPIEIADDSSATAYNEWFEQHHLEPLRSVWPEQYRAVLGQVRSFVLSAEDDDEEEKGKSNQAAEEKSGSKSKRKAKAKDHKARR